MVDLTTQFTQELESDVLKRQSTKQLVVNKVEVTGGDFSDRYYKSLVSSIIDEKNVLSLKDLNGELSKIEKRLVHTGLFSRVDISLDLDKSISPAIIKGPIPVQAKINVSQLPLYKYSSNSSTTDYDAGAGFRYINPNLFKNSTSLLADININYDPLENTLNRKIWDLNILVPLTNFPATRAVFNPTIALSDARAWASHEQYSVGAFLGAQSTKIFPSGTGIFTTGLSFTNRQVRNVSNSASDRIRTDAGDDIKIGIQGNYKYDSRTLLGQFPLKGILFDITNEFSGFNSSDSVSKASSSDKNIELHTFNKTLFKFEGVKSLFSDNITTSLQFEAGTIFDKSDGKVHVSDRFTLGGLNSLRGFRLNSVGLKDGNDYIGGTSVFKAGFSLFSRIPNTSKNSPLRLHAFVNAGDNYDFKDIDEAKKTIISGDFIKKSAVASGLGLVYKSNNAIADLSYNFPLSSRTQDEVKPALDFSISLNFA